MGALFQKKSVAIIFIGLLVAVAGYLVWLNLKPANLNSALQTAVVTKGNLLVTVSASGSISSGGTATVSTLAGGIVTGVYVTDGQQVKRGDKIADIQLDTNGQQNKDKIYSKYLSAKNTLEAAKAKQFALQAQMFTDNQTFMNGAVAGRLPSYNPTYAQQNAQWLSSEAQYKNQQAVIDQAQVDMTTTWNDYQNSTGVISAPMAGTVSGLKAIKGMVIQASTGQNAAPTNLAFIKSAKQVFGIFQVSEMDISKVAIGQKSQIAIPAIPGGNFTGKVLAIDSAGIAKSGLIHYPVTISIDNPSRELLGNMSADVKIITSEKDNVLIVPAGSVQDKNGTSFVQTVKNGKIKEVPVKAGLSNDTQVEIVSGLSQNETILNSLPQSQQNPYTNSSVFGEPSNAGNLAAPAGGN